MYWYLKDIFRTIIRIQLNIKYFDIFLFQSHVSLGNRKQMVCEIISSNCVTSLENFLFWCFKDTFMIIMLVALILYHENSTEHKMFSYFKVTFRILKKRLNFGKYKTESLRNYIVQISLLKLLNRKKKEKRWKKRWGREILRCYSMPVHLPSKNLKNDLEVARAVLGLGPPFHIKELKRRSLFFSS